MTKHDLQQYCWLQKNINRLEEHLLVLDTEATRVTTRLKKDPRGSSHSVDKLSGLVAQIVDTKDKINDQLVKSYEIRNQIEDAIKQLPEKEKYLIRAKYIEGGTWEQIAVDMGYTWRHLHRVHARALKLLA